jgi:hypothetical protein
LHSFQQWYIFDPTPVKKHFLYSASILFASLLIAAALVFARRPAQPQSDNGQQLKEFKAQISRLEIKAASLQKELDQLRKQTPAPIYTPANQLIPPATTGSEPLQIPLGSKPFEFNGVTYYFTPLGHKPEVSMIPTKQTDTPSIESFKFAR